MLCYIYCFAWPHFVAQEFFELNVDSDTNRTKSIDMKGKEKQKKMEQQQQNTVNGLAGFMFECVSVTHIHDKARLLYHKTKRFPFKYRLTLDFDKLVLMLRFWVQKAACCIVFDPIKFDYVWVRVLFLQPHFRCTNRIDPSAQPTDDDDDGDVDSILCRLRVSESVDLVSFSYH